MGERLAGQRQPIVHTGPVWTVELLHRCPVVGGVDDHDNMPEVLGRRPHQRGPTDIDLLDEGFDGRARVGRRPRKRVQVDHDHVDRAYPLRLDRFQVVGPVTTPPGCLRARPGAAS